MFGGNAAGGAAASARCDCGLFEVRFDSMLRVDRAFSLRLAVAEAASTSEICTQAADALDIAAALSHGEGT